MTEREQPAGLTAGQLDALRDRARRDLLAVAGSPMHTDASNLLRLLAEHAQLRADLERVQEELAAERAVSAGLALQGAARVRERDAARAELAEKQALLDLYFRRTTTLERAMDAILDGDDARECARVALVRRCTKSPAEDAAAPQPAARAERECNRHNDCDAADAAAKERGYARADHCHDDCCEDCFGQ